MTKFELKYLNELCEINIGKTPARAEADYWSGDNKWLSIADIKNKYLKTTKETITEFAVEKCNMKLIPKNTVVMSFKLSLGKMAILKEDMYSNEAIASFPILKPDTVLPEYLYYALKTVKLEEYADKAAKGITLNKKKLNQIKIPYTNIRNQKKIVSIMKVAEDLVSKRQSQITALDELTQGLFLDMFGDPLKNTKELPMKQLGSILEVKGGYAFKSKDFIDEGVPVIKIGTANKGYFDEKTLAFLPNDYKGKYEDYLVSTGDLLITLTGTVGKDDYGNICRVDGSFNNYLLNQRVAKFEIKSDLTKSYLYHCFKNKSYKEQLTKASRGVRQANISNNDIKKLIIPIPPMEDQIKFEEIILKIDDSKIRFLKSLEEVNSLYNSLLKSAFKGELFQ